MCSMLRSSLRTLPLKIKVCLDTGMPWYFLTFSLISKIVSKKPTSIENDLPLWGSKITSIVGLERKRDHEIKIGMGGFVLWICENAM